MKFPAHSPYAIRSLIEQRLSEERLLIPRRSEAELSVPLCYPSPYHVAMSSLGYQVVYRLLNDPAYPRLRAERAFLPDDVEAWRRARLPLVTYESQAAVGLSPVILFSVAYELELCGLFSCLELAAVNVLQSERGAGQPLVICGGPLTFSNPLPLGPFADIVIMGEAEEVLPRLMRDLLDAGLSDGQLLGADESPVNVGFQLLATPHLVPGTDKVIMQVVPQRTALMADEILAVCRNAILGSLGTRQTAKSTSRKRATG